MAKNHEVKHFLQNLRSYEQILFKRVNKNDRIFTFCKIIYIIM